MTWAGAVLQNFTLLGNRNVRHVHHPHSTSFTTDTSFAVDLNTFSFVSYGLYFQLRLPHIFNLCMYFTIVNWPLVFFVKQNSKLLQKFKCAFSAEFSLFAQ